VQRRDRDLDLPVDAQRLRRRGQTPFEESLESFLAIPDLHDAIAEIHRDGRMQVDARLGLALDLQFVHYAPIFFGRHAMHVQSGHDCHMRSSRLSHPPATASTVLAISTTAAVAKPTNELRSVGSTRLARRSQDAPFGTAVSRPRTPHIRPFPASPRPESMNKSEQHTCCRS